MIEKLYFDFFFFLVAEIDEPPIASFDEWTKRKLEEEQNRTHQLIPEYANGPKTGTGHHDHANGHPRILMTRNYASHECGAKVIEANPEAQNAKAVLNGKYPPFPKA